MQIVVTTFLNQLYELLARGSAIVTLYAEKEAGFIPALDAWLIECESVLKSNRRPQVGEIAGVRAQLLSASRAVYDRNAISVPAKGSSRKTFHACAAILFHHAVNVLGSQYRVFSERKDEAEKLVRQILLVSLQKGSFFSIWNSELGPSHKLSDLWESFAADKDLAQGTRQVLSAVHYVDALGMLGEAIDDLKL